MPVNNADVAEIFNDVADLLDIKGENQFRIRAYRNAARTVAELSKNVADLAGAPDKLAELPGIGADLAGKIATIVKTGRLPLLEDLKKQLPPGILLLMKIRGLGPKKVKILFKELGIDSLDKLRKAVDGQKIRELRGFGETTELAIKSELDRITTEKKGGERISIARAEQIAEPLLAELRKAEGAARVIVAGSYRRRLETVGDLDVLATTAGRSDVMDRFVGYEDVSKILAKGPTRSTVVLRSGLQVDLRVIPESQYGAALVYFTGSKAHSIEMRKVGIKRGLKINEYGVFRVRDNRRIAGKTEAEVYGTIGLPFIEPELRENRGEIEAARAGKIPKLLTSADIKGDLHVHTDATDGHFSIEEMAKAARERGLEYIAIADHSRAIAMAFGLNPRTLAAQGRKIDKIRSSLRGIAILKSCEVDILENGKLDLPDESLAELDVVICSVHSRFQMPREKQTERIIRAMENRRVDVFCHPSGRLIGVRPAYAVDMEKIIEAARERNVALELNAHPDRLDLNDVHCKAAKEAGVKVVISTDAHSVDGLDFMRFGVGQARRGWLEPSDVLNTRPWAELRRLLKR